MNKYNKRILFYITIVLLIITCFLIFKSYRGELSLEVMRDTLKEYFENNNSHIAEHDFSINNIVLRCIGNDAYIVDFDLILNDDDLRFNKLGATIYKKNDKWNVKGFGVGLTSTELELYDFKCYD